MPWTYATQRKANFTAGTEANSKPAIGFMNVLAHLAMTSESSKCILIVMIVAMDSHTYTRPR